MTSFRVEQYLQSSVTVHILSGRADWFGGILFPVAAQIIEENQEPHKVCFISSCILRFN